MVNRVNKGMRHIGLIKHASRQLLGKSLSNAVSQAAVDQVNAASSPNPIPGYKKGGRVKRTGIARLHKGEVVLTKSAAKTLKKLLNK